MTDRELLEYAAKAAGLSSDVGVNIKSGHLLVTSEDAEQPFFWNPLTDDGDAFRLMVKLGIVFDPVMSPLDGSEPSAAVVAPGSRHYVIEPFANDPYAATRRAIVRAAAEIGKGMV